MAGTNPGKFGTRKSPATLDISQIIRRVEWVVGGNILMVRLYSQIRKPATPTAQVSSLGAYSGDAFENVIHVHDDHSPVPVVQLPKISKEMIAHSLVWNKAPKKNPSANETFNVYQGLLFFNTSRIKSYNDLQDQQYQVEIVFPASKTTTEAGFILYAFNNVFGWEYAKAHPQTTGAIIDAEGHTGIVFTVIVFGNETDRSNFLGWNAGSLPPWEAHDEPSTGEVHDLLQWEMEAWSFKSRKEFPVNDEFKPTFGTHGTGNFGSPTIVDEAKGHGFEQDHATVDHDIPQRTVTIDLNLKSMAFTMKKV